MTQTLSPRLPPVKAVRAPALTPLVHPVNRIDPILGGPLPRNITEAKHVRGMIYKLTTDGDDEQSAEEYQREQMHLCSKSIYWWINHFVWTYVIRKFGPDGVKLKKKEFDRHIPMVSWPVHDIALRVILRCIDRGEDLILDKSRDLGASWILITVATWYWLFHKDSQIGINSRVEQDVDHPGNPKALFWKIDYIIRHLPEWMHPAPLSTLSPGVGLHRSKLKLVNPLNGSVIRGSASHGHASRGDRLDFEIFDEMAAQEHARESWAASGDATNCRIGNSTPIGPGTAFTEQRNMGLKYNSPKVVVLGYWNHPDKGVGRKWVQDKDGTVTGEVGQWYYETPWFIHQRPPHRARTHQDISQNILINHLHSGNTFFNITNLARHRDQYARPPLMVGELLDGEFTPMQGGRWRVWRSYEPNEEQIRKGIDPRLKTNFVIGLDPSYGKGAANSAACVMDRNTYEIIAEFADPTASPRDLAIEAMAAGRYWCGNMGAAFIGWEVNGPGEDMYRDFLDDSYPFVYYKRQLGQKGESKTKQYGWRSGRKEKKILLTEFERAFITGRLICYSLELLEEAMEYIHYEDGQVGAGKLLDILTGAREAHGDRVIAAAVTTMLCREAPKYMEETEPYPHYTLGQIAGHDEFEGRVKPNPMKTVYKKRPARHNRRGGKPR